MAVDLRALCAGSSPHYPPWNSGHKHDGVGAIGLAGMSTARMDRGMMLQHLPMAEMHIAEGRELTAGSKI